MTPRPAGHRVRGGRVARDKEDHHMFFLQAAHVR